MTYIDPRLAIGGNNPPFYETIADDIDAYMGLCADVIGDDVTADNASQAAALKNKGTELLKTIEAARKAEKQPFMNAAKQVDDNYKPLADQVNRPLDAIKAALQSYLVAEEARKRAEAAEKARLAEIEHERAMAAMAQSHNPDSMIDAADADEAMHNAKLAEINATHAAAKAASPTNVASYEGRAVTLKTTRQARVIDAQKLVLHFAAHPDVIEVAAKLANAAIRGAKGGAIDIPGVEIIEIKGVA